MRVDGLVERKLSFLFVHVQRWDEYVLGLVMFTCQCMFKYRMWLKMRIVFLGTNGWYSTGLGNTSCVLIDSDEYYVVLDAGDGIHKLDSCVKNEKPIRIFLSHLHLDHIIGLHAMGRFKFTQKIDLYGYRGTKDGLGIIRHPYTSPFTDLPLRIEVHDLDEGRHSLPFPVACRLLVHADPCLGFRIELDDAVVTYCTDTGICDSLHELAENADMLIAECSFKSGQAEWKWPHLRPEDAAKVARKASVGRLVLTHFDASIYRTKEDRQQAEAAARKIFEKTIAAHDGLEIEL